MFSAESGSNTKMLAVHSKRILPPTPYDRASDDHDTLLLFDGQLSRGYPLSLMGVVGIDMYLKVASQGTRLRLKQLRGIFANKGPQTPL